MTKAVREAKVNSTWASPNESYERSVLALVERALDPQDSSRFLAAFAPFAERVARLAVDNSLVQTALKLTVPGMPDTYQGTELWDLSLVDPDNRRAVDYELRVRLLDALTAELGRDPAGTMAKLRESWRDGRIKLALTATLLKLRRDHADLFANGDYDACEVSGSAADELCAFARRHGSSALVVVVRRFPARGSRERELADTTIALPQNLPAQSWVDVLTGTQHAVTSAPAARDLFRCLPVAVLTPAPA